ncbi:hypothetical protein T479_06275 [Lysinibacillus varians]|nr:hypothetical protein T479_06275 [Lysinibacillus varians]
MGFNYLVCATSSIEWQIGLKDELAFNVNYANKNWMNLFN